MERYFNKHNFLRNWHLQKIVAVFLSVTSSIIFSTPFIARAAEEAPQTFSLSGTLYQTGTTKPLKDPQTKILIQILDSNKVCLLYEEQQTVNVGESGHFNIRVGSATNSTKRTINDPRQSMTTIFQNVGMIFAGNLKNTVCPSGYYFPSAGDTRYIRLTVTPSSTGVPDQLSPDITMNSSPSALVAQSVQGLERNKILQIKESNTITLNQNNLEWLFNNTNFTKLQTLLSGGLVAGTNSGVALPSVTSNPSSPVEGSLWYDSVNKVIKYSNGTTAQTLGAGGGGSGVSSLTVGSNLTADGTAGGTLSAAGTIDLKDSGVTAGSYSKVTVNAKGLVTGSASLSESDIPTLSTAGKVSASAINAGTMGGTAAINTSGAIATTSTITATGNITSSGTVTSNNISTNAIYAPSINGGSAPSADLTLDSTSDSTKGKIILAPTGGNVGIGTSTPATKLDIQGTSGNTLKIVDGNQGAGKVLTSDANGVASWQAPAGGGGGGTVTSVTAAGTAGNPITVGGSAADPTIDIAVATGSNNGYLSSADWTTFNNKLGSSTSFSGDVSGNYNSTSVDKIKGKAVSATAPTAAGQVLRYDGTSTYVPTYLSLADIRSTVTPANTMFPASTCTSAQTMTWSSLTDTMTCSNIAISNTAVSGLGTAATLNVGTGANNIVQLDTNSKLPAVDGSQLTNISVSASNITTGTLAVANGGTGTTDGSITGTGALTFAAGGTNQNVTLTPSGTGYTILNGSVGIGTNTPGSALDVKGAIHMSGATSGYTGFQPAAAAGSTVWTLPAADGTNGQALTTNGAGVLAWSDLSTGGLASLNGQTGGTQTFATPGTTGTAPNWSSTSNTHTLNIPMASTATVTAGLISKTDYDNFNGKLSPTLTSTQIFVGNVSNVATGVAMSGDATIDNTGALSVNKIKGTAVSAGAGNAGEFLVYDGTTQYVPVAMSGDATMASSGAVTLKNTGTAGTYGSATESPVLTTDAQGRVTGVTNTTITPAWSSITSKPTTLSGYGITNAITNVGGTPSVESGVFASRPAAGTAGRLYISTDTKIIYRDTGAAWEAIGDGAAGGVTSVATGTGLSGGPITSTGTISLADTSVGAGNYGSATSVATFTVDAQGRLTAAANVAIPTADNATTGLLTSADWTTFNNKLGTSSSFSGDVSGNYNSTSVDKIKGKAVSATAPTAAGQVLRYDGTSTYVPAYLSLADIRSTVTPANTMFPASTCTAAQTMTWSSLTDTMTCSNIAISNTAVSGLGTAATLNVGTGANNIVQLDANSKLPAVDGSQLTNVTVSASNITTGTLAVANGGTGTTNGSITGTGALTFAAGGTNQNVTLTPSGTGYTILNGNVGIGTSNPSYNIHIASAANATIATYGADTNQSGLQFGVSPTNGWSIGQDSAANSRKFFIFRDHSAVGGSTGHAVVINDAGQVGIGTISPDSTLTMVKDGAAADLNIKSYGTTGTTIRGYRARNTLASPQALQTGDRMLRFSGDGYDGSSERTGKAYITMLADGNWSTTSLPSRIEFAVVPSGSQNTIDAMVIKNDGSVGIGTTTPSAKLEVNGSIKMTDGNQGAGKVLTSDANGVASWQAPAVGGGGTVTSVTAAGTAGNPISVGGTAADPTIDIAAANGSNNGYLSSTDWTTFNSKLGTGTSFSGDVSGNYNSTSVDKIKGKAVSATAPSAAGQVLRYDGTSTYVPTYLSLADIRSTVTPANTMFPASTCTAAQTMTWSSLTDTMTCSNIAIAGSQVSGNISGNAANVTGTVALANGGTGATTQAGAANAVLPSQTGLSGKFLTTNGTDVSWGTVTSSQWTAGTGKLYYNTGSKVGIGTSSPSGFLTVAMTSSGDTTYFENISTQSNGTVRGSNIYAATNGAVSNAKTVGARIQGYTSSAQTGTSSNLGLEVITTSDSSIPALTGASVAVSGDSSGTGSIPTITGFNLNVSTGSTVTNQYGINLTQANAGTITNRYAINIAAPTGAGTATNDYGIYQDGSSQKNYFAGKMGIGTISPETQAHIANLAGTGTTLTVGNPSVAGNNSNDGTIKLYGEDTGAVYSSTITQASGNMIITANSGSSNVVFGSNILAMLGKTLTVEDSSGTKKATLAHDGTNGVLSVTSGNIVLSGGNVGISNTSPSLLLHVGSASTATGQAVANFQNADGTCTITPAASGSGIACSSDERLKENFQDVTGEFALEKILKLQAVTYNFKTSSVTNRRTGYIAQEVQKVAPEFVRENNDGYLQIYYDAFIPWITESIKTLYKKIAKAEEDQVIQSRQIASIESTKANKAEVETKIQSLEAENEKLKQENASIKAYLCSKDPAAPICN